MQINKRIVCTIAFAAIIYYFYLQSFITNYISSQVDIHMILVLVLCFYIYLLITIIIDRHINRNERYAFKYIYVIMLITLFFSKSINTTTYVETFNLNISNVKYSFSNNIGYILLITNVLLIIPLGYMFRRLDPIVKILLPLLIFLFVEYIQYDNMIGVFDINDIILNTIGFYIGGFLVGKVIK